MGVRAHEAVAIEIFLYLKVFSFLFVCLFVCLFLFLFWPSCVLISFTCSFSLLFLSSLSSLFIHILCSLFYSSCLFFSFFSCLSSLSLYGSSFKYGRLEQERSLLSASWRTIDYQFQVEETTWRRACCVNRMQLWTRRVTISNDKSTKIQEVLKQLQASTSVTYLWLIRV
jgi:hypothetical protein